MVTGPMMGTALTAVCRSSAAGRSEAIAERALKNMVGLRFCLSSLLEVADETLAVTIRMAGYISLSET
jgi:hypothetical protein